MKNNWISQPGNHLQKIWSEHEILVSTNIHHLIIPSYHELNLLSEKYSGFAISKCKEPIYFQGISNQLSFHFFQDLMLRNLSTWSHFFLLLFFWVGLDIRVTLPSKKLILTYLPTFFFWEVSSKYQHTHIIIVLKQWRCS